MVSKDAENKEKGFQKLTDLEEAESEQITTDWKRWWYDH